jgi:hypothetical protein
VPFESVQAIVDAVANGSAMIILWRGSLLQMLLPDVVALFEFLLRGAGIRFRVVPFTPPVQRLTREIA